MKFSTSPPLSRCSSPMLSRSNSSLPTPATYRFSVFYFLFLSMVLLDLVKCYFKLFIRQDCFGAATKFYKYLRKLAKFEQMDFEFATWQMIYLFTSPQKVYRNFQSRKRMYHHQAFIYIFQNLP